EFDGSGSLVRARPSSPSRLSQGARFTMRMRRAVPYAMVSTVIEFDEDRAIAWAPTVIGLRWTGLFGRIWRYELEPVDGGTRVRETWDLSHDSFRWFLRRAYSRRFRDDMVRSLDLLDKMTARAAQAGESVSD
ncbi:MAG: hypothetical protein KGJ36_02505, partial [Acidobacteriota bacterium]|nr:hypothetical protein [Acidobacteriota bacterium]